jgi:hypothetical protein
VLAGDARQESHQGVALAAAAPLGVLLLWQARIASAPSRQ